MIPLPLSRLVAHRIRAFRDTRRITGDAFAEGVTAHGYKLTRSMLANIENGRFKTVPVDLVGVILKYLDVSWYAFFEGPLCNACSDSPPKEYICKTCGRSGGDPIA